MRNKLDQLIEKVPEHTRLMVAKSFDISERILDILDSKDMSQKEFALLLGKKESEVSRWMKGSHNFTLETIAKIEIALGETILDTSYKRTGASKKILKPVVMQVSDEGAKYRTKNK